MFNACPNRFLSARTPGARPASYSTGSGGLGLRLTDHSPAFRTDVTNEWSHTSTMPYVFVTSTGTTCGGLLWMR